MQALAAKPITREELNDLKKLIQCLDERGARVSPEEIGTQMVHGPEGSNVTALLKTPIAKPKE